MKFNHEWRNLSSTKFEFRLSHVSLVILITCFLCNVSAFSSPSVNTPLNGWIKVRTIDQSSALLSQSMTSSDLSLGRNGTTSFLNSNLLTNDQSDEVNNLNKNINSLNKEKLSSVVLCSLLITGNTVGASMMVLPQFAASIGMHNTLGVMGVMYVLNLLSGLTISEVAIKQYEMGCDPPTSFKTFANVIIGEKFGSFVAALFIFINWCVVAFGLTRFGEMIREQVTFSMNPVTISSIFCALLSALTITLPPEKISKISALCTSLLFFTFGAILIPGLSSMQDPTITLGMTPVSNENIATTFGSAAPVFLTALIYQNIVPTVVKLLSYDRASTVTALTVGSTIPSLMYLSYILATLGGGIDPSTVDPTIVTAFATVSLTGGCIAAILSLAEEFTSVINDLTKSDIDQCVIEENTDVSAQNDSGASIPSVILATTPPLVVGALYSHGSTFVDALKWAGTYGSPMVYGVLPPALAFLQRKLEKNSGYTSSNIVPGGNYSLIFLAFTYAVFAVGCSISGFIS